MAKMTVHMLGIMYFDVCKMKNPPIVIFPDGTMEGADGTPPHFASIFVERARYEADTWPGETIVRELSILTRREETVTVPVLEFRANTFTEIAFPPDRSRKVDLGDLTQGLQSIIETDPNFDPDLSGNGAVARITIGSGQLRAYRFNNGTNAVQWTIDTGNAPLTITGTDASGKSGSIFLKPQPNNPLGAEVVLSNMPDFLTGVVPGNQLRRHDHGVGPSPHAVHHFGLYAKIDKNHGNPRFPSHFSDIPYRTAVMASLADAEIQNSCGPWCC